MSLSSINSYRLTIRLVKAVFFVALIAVLFAVITPLLVKTYNVSGLSKKGKLTVSSVDIMQNTAQNPRFYGMDTKNQPYSIQAKAAVQLKDKSLELDQVFASYTLKDNKLVSVAGNSANLDADNSRVNINGNVVIMYDDLYSLNAQNTELNYKDGLASGDSNVELISNLGRIEATNFEIKENYNDIKFFGGRVKTTLYPKESQNEIR